MEVFLLAAAAVILLLLLFYIKPIAGLYVSLLLGLILTLNITHISPTTIVPNYYPLALGTICLMALACMARAALRRECWVSGGHEPCLAMLMAGLAMWSVISIFWSLDFRHGICEAAGLVMGLVLMALMWRLVQSERALHRIFLFLALLAPLFGTITLLSKYYSFNYSMKLWPGAAFEFSVNLFRVMEEVKVTGGVEYRPGGFATPQVASNILGFFIFCLIAVIPFLKSLFTKVAVAGCGFYLFMVMLMTSAKGGILGFILGLYMVIFLNVRLSRRFFSWSATALGAIMLVVAFNMLVMKEARLAGSSGSGDIAEASFSSRLGFWETGFELMADRWIGAGAGGLLAVIDPIPGAHSVYFSVLFDLGVPGFILFMAVIFEIALRMRRGMLRARNGKAEWFLYCMAGAYALLLFHSIVDLDYNMIYFWIVPGLGLLCARIADGTAHSVTFS